MVTNTQPLTFGIKTSQANTTYQAILDVWRDADATEVFEDAWLWDHLVPLRGDVRGPALEAWTLLSALAAQTRRLRLGVIVTSNRTRPPAVLAKMAATVDHISDGRLIFGIGAGGSAVKDPGGLAMVHRELDGYGIPVVPTRQAIESLAEACQIVERMWTEDEPFDFDGRWYQLKGAICEPKPVQRPRPPIMIGAAGERSLRIVAEHADIWNCPTRGDFAEFRRLDAILDAHCADIGRDPADITRSVQFLVAAGRVDAGIGQGGLATPAQGRSGASVAGFPNIGDPAATRHLLLQAIDAGVRHLVLAPILSTVDRPARWLADEIVGPVLEEARLA
jgi:alkanesulfonate monooxygenase SsuD/methylene tetrahydromethanopterin reductase-like flavin-dependent oxidoreductase (luciferase family)